MTADILSCIHNKMSGFSKGQKRIAAYILESYDKAAFQTAGTLGRTVNVSESTVVRFAAELGSSERLGEQDILSTILQSDMDKLRVSMECIDRTAFAGAVDALLSARRVYILGVRSSAALAEFFGYYLNYMFEDVRVVTGASESEMFEKIVHVAPQDAVVGISFPRYSTATSKALQYCASAGAQVIALTDCETAPIAQSADYLLTAKSDMVSLVDSLVAPMSLINALIVAVASLRRQEVTKTLDSLERVWDRYGVYEKVDG